MKFYFVIQTKFLHSLFTVCKHTLGGYLPSRKRGSQ